MAYQVLPDDAIPLIVKTDVGLHLEEPHGIDALWAYLGSRCKLWTNCLEFDQL